MISRQAAKIAKTEFVRRNREDSTESCPGGATFSRRSPRKCLDSCAKRAPQQWLTNEQERQIARRIHIEVQQQRELFKRRMWQQMRFVADENRMLLLALVQVHDGCGDLPHQVAAEVCRFEVQGQGDLVNTRAAVDLPAPTSPVSKPAPGCRVRNSSRV